ncbi:MAG TPA: hypothetical protein V6D47_01810 [Oscillatoriaceae cyanobacterium]
MGFLWATSPAIAQASTLKEVNSSEDCTSTPYQELECPVSIGDGRNLIQASAGSLIAPGLGFLYARGVGKYEEFHAAMGVVFLPNASAVANVPSQASGTSISPSVAAGYKLFLGSVAHWDWGLRSDFFITSIGEVSPGLFACLPLSRTFGPGEFTIQPNILLQNLQLGISDNLLSVSIGYKTRYLSNFSFEGDLRAGIVNNGLFAFATKLGIERRITDQIAIQGTLGIDQWSIQWDPEFPAGKNIINISLIFLL